MHIRAAVVLVLFLDLVQANQSHSRSKRFLNSDSWTLLPDSLPRLGDYARNLGDQLVAQASMAVRHMMPQARSSVRHGELGQGRPETTKRRVPIGRETEGEEKEVEFFDPEEVERPQVPDSGEKDWFRPLVPFSFSFGLLTPWWQGQNVCVEKSEVEEPERDSQDFSGFNINFETTRCIPSDSSYICTKKIQSNGMRKTIIVKHQCCHGYIRRTDGRAGCAALKLESLIDTMKVLEMGRFVQWIENAGLREKLSSGNYTVFTPSNGAITDYEDETEDNEISAIDPVKRTADVSSLVRGHIVEGFENVDHLEDDQLLSSLNGDAKIRINKYHPAHEIVTVNCIPVSGKNNFATNGIVHLTSGVLPQPTKTVGEIIGEDHQFTAFRKLLEESGMMEELKKEGQSWTLFAPTDNAFKKLSRSLRNQIDSGEACVQNILHQHLVRGTVCTSAVINQIKIKNILGNVLRVTRDDAEKLRVEGGTIDFENNLGTNGVIHVIEKVLIPPQAQSLLKALEEQDREDILNFIERANLKSELEGMRNVTFFVPSKEAFQNLPNETLQEIENNPELAKKMLLSHIVGSQMSTSGFTDNKNLETLSGYNVHLKLHELFPGIITGATVQCAYVIHHDDQVCGAVIHKINKVLIPPEGNIMETLKEMKDHSIITKMLQLNDLEKKLAEEGPFTFLAPSDDAFERFSDANMKEIFGNKTKAEEILKLHIVPETLCCNSIGHISSFHRQFVRTLDGSALPLHRSVYDRVKFGRATALHCDTQASNGLIHSVNRVIVPSRPATHTFGMELWPF